MTEEEAAEGPSGFNLNEQIACVAREVRMREMLYPKWVQAGRMAQATADRQLGCMKAVLGTLAAMIGRK
jgi:hypothetical protein